jgi:hypothetical protein
LIGLALRKPRARRAAAAALALALPLVAAGCGSGSKPDSPGTFVPGATSGDPGQGGTPTSTAGTASRAAPLAQREFRVDPEPRTTSGRAVVRALEGYLDGLVTAFATNDVGRSGIHRFAAPNMVEDAKRLVAEQAKDGNVLYGPYTFTIAPEPAAARVAVVGVCINQSSTRLHDARTDMPKRRNDTPYVRLTYTLTRLEAGWLVTAYSGKAVASCPA